MRHLLLLALLCGSPALARQGPQEDGCAEGPTYWCRNLVTALQCSALGHCMQEGWSPATNEDACADCKQVVSILIRMAKESSFKRSIQKYLEEECATLPLQTLVPRCQDLVDTYYALFIVTLEGQVQPDATCAKVGLCAAGKKDTSSPQVPELERLLWAPPGEGLLLPNSQAQGSPGEQLPIPLPMCWLCRNFMGKVESLVPKAAISKSMAQLCHMLPLAATGMCECMMEKYSVILVDMIIEKLGPRLICGMMRMCVAEESVGQERPRGAASVSEGSCRACLAITERAKASLQATNSTSQAGMEVALLTACTNRFLDWPECKRFLQQHQPTLSTLLAKPWDPKTTCQELGACMAEEESSAGDAACARGPIYWCSSLGAAEHCKAVHHCQAHVWP